MVLLTGLVLVITISYKWSHHRPQLERLGLVPCELNAGPCQVALGEGSLNLALSPRPIRPLRPLQVVLEVQGHEVQGARVIFTGVDVEMGRLAFELARSGPGRFAGEASLSICSQGRMTWQALLVVEAADRTWQVPFHFESAYRSSSFIILE